MKVHVSKLDALKLPVQVVDPRSESSPNGGPMGATRANPWKWVHHEIAPTNNGLDHVGARFVMGYWGSDWRYLFEVVEMLPDDPLFGRPEGFVEKRASTRYDKTPDYVERVAIKIARVADAEVPAPWPAGWIATPHEETR